MKKFYCVLSTVFLLISLTGCKKEENKQPTQVSTQITMEEKYTEEDVKYQSGDIDVYATVTMPVTKEKVPYVVMVMDMVEQEVKMADLMRLHKA